MYQILRFLQPDFLVGPHLVLAASWAISERLFLDSFRALAAPPFKPPSRPKLTAAGFLATAGFEGLPPVALPTMECASAFTSLGLLDRLGIALTLGLGLHEGKLSDVPAPLPGGGNPLREVQGSMSLSVANLNVD